MAQQVPEETFSSPEHQAWLAERRGQHPLDPLPLGPQTTSGVTSGPGNQGTANVAHLVGQAGTAGTQLSVPRSLRFGQGSQS